jgi:hypothetical protein
MAKAPTTEQLPELAETFDISVNGEDRSIFMSFGLLNDLTSIVGDPGAIASLTLNPDMRNGVLKSALAKRKKSGKIEEEVDIDDLDVSIKDVEALLDWVSGHVMSFFVRSLRKVAAVNEKYEAPLRDLVSSLGGSKSSASVTPSSGPSE